MFPTLLPPSVATEGRQRAGIPLRIARSRSRGLQAACACRHRRSDGRIGARRENGIRDITLACSGLYRLGNKKMTEGKKDYGKKGKTAELGWVFETPQ